MAMYYLTEQQVKLLQEILDAHRNTSVNGRSRQDTERSWDAGEDHQAPEVYVAKPLYAYGSAGTGTEEESLPGRTDPGTGTETYSIPGLAKCAIYQVVDDTFGSPRLKPLGGGTPEDYHKWVYNVFTNEGTDYFPVVRTKQGQWVAMVGGGSGAPYIRFQVLSAGSFYQDTSAECNTVIAQVLDVSCSASGVAYGDEVTIWDPSGCWFSIPIENLENSYGTAVKMNRGSGFAIEECSDDNPTETCFWMVVTLCCLEEVAGS